MTEPEVSVIVPVYNRPALVVEAVDSVLAQSSTTFEIVVVDDGSTDETEAVVRSLVHHDARIKVLRQDNGGPSAARNAGVAASTAPLVTFLDSDDLMEPGRLRRQLDAWRAQSHQRPVIIGQERLVIAEGTEPPPHIIDRLRLGTTRYESCALLSRDQFDAVGGFDIALRLAEDVDLLIRLEDDGCSIIEIDEVLVIRRIQGDNLVYDPEIHRSMFHLLRRRIARSRARSASSPPELGPAAADDHG